MALKAGGPGPALQSSRPNGAGKGSPHVPRAWPQGTLPPDKLLPFSKLLLYFLDDNIFTQVFLPFPLTECSHIPLCGFTNSLPF